METQVFFCPKYFLFISLLLFSCNSKSNQETQIETEEKTNEELSTGISAEEEFALGFDISTYLVEVNPDSTETFYLRQNCAIFIGPSEDQLNELRRQFGYHEFADIVDDNVLYEIVAKETLNTYNICNLSTNKRYIVFTKPDGSHIVIDTKAPYSLKWNLMFFHLEKDPEVIDILEIETQKILSYFDIRRPI